MLLGFSEYATQARRLATALDIRYQDIDVHYFPDGECKVTVPGELPRHVIICRSLDRPNNKLIELILAAKTMRKLGVSRLSLVAPYLCYMRQDTAFNEGEAVSQRIIGDLLVDLFDAVITIDPHLHRIHSLQEVLPGIYTKSLTAAPAMAEFLKRQNVSILIGPDVESEQWVQAIAEMSGLSYGVGRKKRFGDRDIELSLPDIKLTDKSVVLVDDVVSSGQTIANAAQRCLSKGASRVDVLVTHPLFAPGATDSLKQAGVREIWSTDSIRHDSNVIQLAELFKDALKEIS
jgi:ribose-phosphate pyrophosphokinase